MNAHTLAAKLARGDRRALAQAITLVENEPKGSRVLMSAIKPKGTTFVLGITGPPGTGKSTLVDRIIGIYRRKGLKVGVIAVDPSSPITGGALLGDRIRMSDHAGDRQVFIRSMASRGWSGGLSRAASQAVVLMEAAGFDLVVIETVGIGQADIEVVGVAHAVLVVLMPGLGDEVQVSKAGLMEVGDVYVVNKSDIPGADHMMTDILGLVRTMKRRPAAVVKVSARSGEGLQSLEKAIEEVRSRFLSGAGDLQVKSARGIIVEVARGLVMERFGNISDAQAERLARLVVDGKLSFIEAAEKLAR